MKRLILAATAATLALPHLAVAQVRERIPLPGAQLERPPAKDTRPAGPAPGMIYGTAMGPTTAKVTWSTVAAANGYQLYRSGGASNAVVMVHSEAATPGLVLAVDPTAYPGQDPRLPQIPYGGSPNTVPPIRHIDLRRSPKVTYTYTVVATYPDTSSYRAGTSAPALLYMPPGLPPAALAATTSLGTTVTLTWLPVPDATGYSVFRDNAPITAQPVRGTSYVDTGLKPGLYTYSVASFFSTEAAGEIPGETSQLPSIQVVLSRCARP
jgi:hypothetical protein